MTDLAERIVTVVDRIDTLELASTGRGYRPSVRGEGTWVAAGQLHAVAPGSSEPLCGYQLPVVAWQSPWSEAAGDVCPACAALVDA